MHPDDISAAPDSGNHRRIFADLGFCVELSVKQTSDNTFVHKFFVQAQFARGYAETVARAIGAKVVTVDPLAEDYLANMHRVARAFEEALD